MIRRLASGVASFSGIRPRRDIIQAAAERNGLNVELHVRLLVTPVDSTCSSPRKACQRVSREERQAMVESFVEKFRAANGGEFPGIVFTRRKVGGSYYVIREILLKLKCQPKASCDNVRKVNLQKEEKPMVFSCCVEEQMVAEEFLNSSLSGDWQSKERSCGVDFSSDKYADRLKAVNFAVYNTKLEPSNTKTSEVDQDLCSESATTLEAEESLVYSEVVRVNEQPRNADFNSVQNIDSFNICNYNSVEDTDSFDFSNIVVDKIQQQPISPASTGSSGTDQDFCDRNKTTLSTGVSTTEESDISIDAFAETENFVIIANSLKIFVDETPETDSVTSSEAFGSNEQSCSTDFSSIQDTDGSDVNDASLVEDADPLDKNNIAVDKGQQECNSPDSLPLKIDQDLSEQSRIVHSKRGSTVEEMTGAFVSGNNVESETLVHSLLHLGSSKCDVSSQKKVEGELQQDSCQDPKSNESGRNLDGRSDIKEATEIKSSVWSTIKSLAGSIRDFWTRHR